MYTNKLTRVQLYRLNEDQPDHCKILFTDQENLGVDTGFKWNEKSLLTGDTIPGADCCIDW